MEDHSLVLSDFSYGRPPNLSWKPFMVDHPLVLGDLSYGGDHPLVFEDHCYGRPPSLRRPILTETTTCLGEYITQDRPLVLTGFLYEITLIFGTLLLWGITILFCKILLMGDLDNGRPRPFMDCYELYNYPNIYLLKDSCLV